MNPPPTKAEVESNWVLPNIFGILKVGLQKHAHKKPSELSGGEKQRVAIARAIVNNPKIITLDEPTGALDSKTSIEIMDLIKEISTDKLVIMVTHNKELSKKYASRIIELKAPVYFSPLLRKLPARHT